MLFVKAFFIGALVAVAIDEMYLLCIQKTLAHGFKAALLIGIGSALADCTFALLAALDIAFISHLFETKAVFVKSACGFFLIFIGLKELWKKNMLHPQHHMSHSSELSLILKTYALEMTNPVTITVIAGVYQSFKAHTVFDVITLMSGVGLAVLLWWILIGFVIARYNHLLSDKINHHIQFASCLCLIAIGGYMIFWG